MTVHYQVPAPLQGQVIFKVQTDFGYFNIQSDSYADAKRRATKAAREFFQEYSAACQA